MIPAINRLDLDDVRAGRVASTGYMYGVDSFEDGPCAMEYDPIVHAEELGVPVVFRDDLPDPEMVACYSASRGAIWVRPSLHAAVERCAIAHELVHHEHRDRGRVAWQEDRADRLAARRLIMPRMVEELSMETSDVARIALELTVTEKIMRIYLLGRANA